MVKKILILSILVFIAFESYCCYRFMKGFYKRVNRRYECIYNVEKLP